MQLRPDDLENMSKFVRELEILFNTFDYAFGDEIDIWDDGEFLGHVEYEHGTRGLVFNPS